MAPLRILLVDDHATFRATAGAFLADRPDLLVAAEAESAEEALDVARRENLDLVLLDLGLGGINGFDTTRLLRRERPQVRIIIVTLHDGAEFRRLAEVAGADAFVNKADFVTGLLPQIHRLFPHLASAGHGTAPLPAEDHPTA
mgnify:CR=1 FL=1